MPTPPADVPADRRAAGPSRRTFLGTAAAGTLTSAAGLRAGDGDDSEPEEPGAALPPVGAFTKSFQDWPIERVCERFAALGLDGLDLTVRPGGHIEPEDAARELPGAVAAAERHGLRVLFLTTAITTADAAADRLLGAAGDAGIPAVKLGYFRESAVPLADRLVEVRREIRRIAVLGETHGVKPCVHTHSGGYVPSHGTLLWELLRDLPPDRVGAYADTLHMVREGGEGGWRQGLELLGPWLTLCAVKNFALEPAGRDRFGMARWNERVVPVADGISPVPEFVATLKRQGFTGPYSLHSEYRGRHSWKSLDTEQVAVQTGEDLKFLRAVLAAG